MYVFADGMSDRAGHLSDRPCGQGSGDPENSESDSGGCQTDRVGREQTRQ